MKNKKNTTLSEELQNAIEKSPRNTFSTHIHDHSLS